MARTKTTPKRRRTPPSPGVQKGKSLTTKQKAAPAPTKATAKNASKTKDVDPESSSSDASPEPRVSKGLMRPPSKGLMRPYSTVSKKGARRWKPGTVALREIKHIQKGTELLVPRLSFARVVRQIAQDKVRAVTTFRWTGHALLAAQYATENYLIGLMMDAQLCAIHSKRITIQMKDIWLARRLRGVRKECVY